MTKRKRTGNTAAMRKKMLELAYRHGWTQQDFIEYCSGRAMTKLQARAEELRKRDEENRRRSDELFQRMHGYTRQEWWDRIFAAKREKERQRAADKQTLGLKPTDTAGDLKRKYKRLAQHHHPDKGGSAEQFHKVRSAYERLQKLYGNLSAE